jgi:hypothetical protein
MLISQVIADKVKLKKHFLYEMMGVQGLRYFLILYDYLRNGSFHFNFLILFFLFSFSNFSGKWSQEGCMVASTNSTHTVCKCNHLTHFAVLFDIYGVQRMVTLFHI